MKEYIATFSCSEQISECDYKIKNPTLKISEQTTIVEIDLFYRKFIKNGQMEIKIIELTNT